ncbi:MAG: ribosome-associated translation inhibitor RaiA [Xanthobacter sp.]
MALRVSGKNIDIGDALRERLISRVSDVISKHYDGGWSGHVTVSREGSGYRSECIIHIDTGVNLQAQGTDTDPHASADAAVDRIERRLRRYKERKLRIKERTPPTASIAAQAYVLSSAPESETDDVPDSWSPTVVAEAPTHLRTLSVADAVVELEITGAPVVVFRHASHGRLGVVYRRADGNVGWIEPSDQAH